MTLASIFEEHKSGDLNSSKYESENAKKTIIKSDIEQPSKISSLTVENSSAKSVAPQINKANPSIPQPLPIVNQHITLNSNDPHLSNENQSISAPKIAILPPAKLAQATPQPFTTAIPPIMIENDNNREMQNLEDELKKLQSELINGGNTVGKKPKSTLCSSFCVMLAFVISN